MELGMEKRTEVLYVRVSPSVRKYIKKRAEQLEVSEAFLIDAVMNDDEARTRGITQGSFRARTKKPVRKRA